MPFEREENVTKDAIQKFSLSFDVVALPSIVNGGVLELTILRSDDQPIVREYPNVLALLAEDAEGQQHLDNLASLRDYILARAANEVLPT